MKSALIYALLAIATSQFTRDMTPGSVVEVINTTETTHFWKMMEAKELDSDTETIELNLPVNHAEDGYSWYADKLYHDCNYNLYQYPWYYTQSEETFFYEQKFVKDQITDIDYADNTQRVKLSSLEYGTSPSLTFWLSRDYQTELCEMKTDSNLKA